jgi:tetratricopeptide (TPR) repeat protein
MYRDAQYGLRVSGNYVCPNHFAGMLELALPLALALALFSGWARPLRQVLGGAVVVMAVGMAFSVSRGGWISLAAGMLVFAALAGTVARAGRRWAMGILLLGAAGAAAVWFTSDLARLRFAQMQNPEVEARVTLFRDAFKVIDLSPWLGTGPATFRYAHHLVQAPSYQTIARYTHNDYLNLVCDYGLVGGVLAAGFLVALVMTLARLRKRQASPEEAAVWLGTCAAVGAWLVHSLFDFNLHLPANAVAFAVCVALPLSHRRRFPLSLPPSRAAGWGLTAFCGVVTVYLIVVGGRSLGAQWHLMRDDRLGDTDEAQSEALCRSALKWDPNQAVAATRLGDLYRVRAALATNGEARVELGATAVAFYETARRANAYETATLRKLALTYEILRRYPEAYLVHQQALKLDPHNPVTARMLGDHYAKRGQLLLARDEYDRALSLRADADTAASRQAVQAAIDKATPRRSAP